MFIVLSLAAVYLFFMGSAVAPRPKIETLGYEQAGLALALGILLNYALLLTGLRLPVALGVGATIALMGVVRFVAAARGRSSQLRVPRWQATAWAACVAYILALYYFQILSEPLFRWDARSVWFFHSKMIWAEGALRASSGWAHPSVDFSSPDYPNLVPALGAELAAVQGHWNEFAPKGSLWLMLLPLVCWVFSFRRLTLAFFLVVALFFFSLHAWLWNGYMDAYVAMYAAGSLLLVGRFAAERRDTDLYSAISGLGIVAATKNEGLLVGAAVAGAVVLTSRFNPAFGIRGFARKLRAQPSFAVIIAIALAPTLLWGAWKRVWGLENHVTANLSGGLGRAVERISDASTALYLVRFLAARATISWLLLGLIVVAAVFLHYRKVQRHPGAAVALVATTLYFCGMVVAYLITPADLTWHLLTSATRVMAVVSFGLLVTIYFLLTSLERNPGDSANPAVERTASV